MVKLWLRAGDIAEYHPFESLEKAAKDLSGLAPGARVLKWLDAGAEVEPEFTGRNYVSIYYGDEEGDFLRNLTDEEKETFENALKGGGYADHEPEDGPVEPGREKA
jgi:hypothetical protein